MNVVNKALFGSCLAVSLFGQVLASAATLSVSHVQIGIGDITTVTAWDTSGGTWVSDKPEIATVTDGMIEGLSVGTAIVTFTSNEGDILECEVNVRDTKANDIIKNDTYLVMSNAEFSEGTILPGQYVVQAERGKFGNYSVESPNSDTGLKYNATILNNDIIEVDEYERVNLSNCSLVPLDNALLDATGSGTFIVGRHLSAGNYVIETDNTTEGQFTIYDSLEKNNLVDAYDIKQDTPYSVNLVDGQLITLNGCKLVG